MLESNVSSDCEAFPLTQVLHAKPLLHTKQALLPESKLSSTVAHFLFSSPPLPHPPHCQQATRTGHAITRSRIQTPTAVTHLRPLHLICALLTRPWPPCRQGMRCRRSIVGGQQSWIAPLHRAHERVGRFPRSPAPSARPVLEPPERVVPPAYRMRHARVLPGECGGRARIHAGPHDVPRLREGEGTGDRVGIFAAGGRGEGGGSPVRGFERRDRIEAVSGAGPTAVSMPLLRMRVVCGRALALMAVVTPP